MLMIIPECLTEIIYVKTSFVSTVILNIPDIMACHFVKVQCLISLHVS